MIAMRVAHICMNALFVYNTDLSRFDGRVSKILRALESMFMMRWVHRDYAADLAELLASQRGQRAKTRFGVKFDTGDSRLSGSPETAAFNTVDDAFMAYKALRKTKVKGEYLTPLEAWNKLGIYGGDDGVTADVDPKAYVAACASVGQKLEIVESPRGSDTVTFLSRLYSRAVWYGSPNSTCDVRRQLAKLHTCASLPPSVSAMQKLREKMTGFFLTDRNTPIIGALATLVVEKFGASDLSLGIANYFSSHPAHSQYPNEDEAGWMVAKIESELPDFDFGMFNSWISKVRDGAADVLSPPLCVPRAMEQPTVKRAVVVNGEVILPKSHKKVTFAQDVSTITFGNMEPVEMRVPVCVEDVLPVKANDPVVVCKHVSDGKCTFGARCQHPREGQKCYGEVCRFEHGPAMCKFGKDCTVSECKYAHAPSVKTPRSVGQPRLTRPEKPGRKSGGKKA
nr:RNA-dependent RNA polymerase [Flumine noda-like virus 1]